MNDSAWRDRRANAAEPIDAHDYSREEQEVPLVHAGFVERVPNNPDWSALLVTVWFSQGKYTCRVQDRVGGDRAFFDSPSLLGLWQALDEAMTRDELVWRPEKVTRH